MGQEVIVEHPRFTAPFNGPVEIGLRSVAVLNSAFPSALSLQRLVVFDYLLVHSDDTPGGPPGLHPKTPRRSGELLVRRKAIQKGLLLYQSRGLVEQRYEPGGLYFAATEQTAGFLDVLRSQYVVCLRERADWVVEQFGQVSDSELEKLARDHLGEWGAEFVMESVLWSEDQT